MQAVTPSDHQAGPSRQSRCLSDLVWMALTQSLSKLSRTLALNVDVPGGGGGLIGPSDVLLALAAARLPELACFLQHQTKVGTRTMIWIQVCEYVTCPNVRRIIDTLAAAALCRIGIAGTAHDFFAQHASYIVVHA